VPGGSQVVFNCPRRMENGRCPACEKADRLKGSGNPADEQLAKEFWPGQRNLCFAVNRDDPEAGIQILAFGATIKNRLRHFREKLGKNFTAFDDGFDIVIERMGQGLKTEYQTDLGEQCPIVGDMAKLEEWVKDLPDLNDFAKVLDYQTILEKFSTAGAPVAAARPAVAAAATVQDDENDVDDGADPY